MENRTTVSGDKFSGNAKQKKQQHTVHFADYFGKLRKKVDEFTRGVCRSSVKTTLEKFVFCSAWQDW